MCVRTRVHVRAHEVLHQCTDVLHSDCIGAAEPRLSLQKDASCVV